MAAAPAPLPPILPEPTQELAETNGELLPDRYIHPQPHRPVLDPPTCAVPVIDLSRLDDDPDSGEGAKLRSALESWGTFHAVGHGIPSSLLDDVRRIAREFFQLPAVEKRRYLTGELEGYGNDRVASEEQILDWNDRLYLLVEPVEDRKMELWPDTPASFRETLEEYTAKSRAAVNKILVAMAKVLGLEESHFVARFGEKAPAYARFNYYPRCSHPDLVFGLKPHVDGSALTVLLQDEEVEGLHLLRDGQWMKVPIVPHGLLVNLGDQMEILTNSIFMSPMHRAVTNSESGRISMVLFYAVEFEKEIGPADALVGAGRPRIYRSVKVKEFLDIFSQYFAQGKRALDWARI